MTRRHCSCSINAKFDFIDSSQNQKKATYNSSALQEVCEPIEWTETEGRTGWMNILFSVSQSARRKGSTRSDGFLVTKRIVDSWPPDCIPIPIVEIHPRENVLWSTDGDNRSAEVSAPLWAVHFEDSADWHCDVWIETLPNVLDRDRFSKSSKSIECFVASTFTFFQISSISRRTSRSMKCRLETLPVVWRNAGMFGPRPRPTKDTTLLYYISAWHSAMIDHRLLTMSLPPMISFRRISTRSLLVLPIVKAFQRSMIGAHRSQFGLCGVSMSGGWGRNRSYRGVSVAR